VLEAEATVEPKERVRMPRPEQFSLF
jgi:hypothetical protein